MKSYQQFMEGSKSCPSGKYYCNDKKKCMPIPRGHYVGRGGYLEKDDDESNGNGNGGNGNGNGGGDGGGGE